MRVLVPALFLIASLAPALAAAEGEDRKLRALFDEAWAFRLAEDPLFATSAGEHRYDDKLPSMTHADLERRAAHARSALERLKGIDRAALSPSDRVSADMFARELSDALADFEFGAYRIPINADSGFHTDFADLPDHMPFATTKDYENYIARLNAFPAYVGAEIALMREGITARFTLPQVVLEGYDVTMTTHVVAAPEKSVFFAPFRAFPPGVPEAERARLTEAGRRAIMQGAVAGYRTLSDFMKTEYVPRARLTIGASALPKGREYYAFLVRRFTTLDLTPDQVHEIGRQEVLRIRAEMDAVMAKTGFQGNFAAFLNFLRTDPRFYAKTPDDLLKDASWIAKRMDGRLPSLFGKVAAPAVRDRARAGAPRAQVHGGPLHRGADRRHAGRRVLGQHLRPRQAAALHARGAHAARSGAGASPPDRPAAGADGAAGIPPVLGRRRVRRGLGALRRAARARGGLLPGPLQRLRSPDLRDVARLPPGRGHRHPRQGLDPRGGASSTSSRTRRSRSTKWGPRSTATYPGRGRRSATRWGS